VVVFFDLDTFLHKVTHSLVWFISKLVWPFIENDIACELLHLPDLEIGLTISVTGRHGMLTSPRHLIPLLVYPEVHVCPIL
jgi:hypothetical protein